MKYIGMQMAVKLAYKMPPGVFRSFKKGKSCEDLKWSFNGFIDLKVKLPIYRLLQNNMYEKH